MTLHLLFVILRTFIKMSQFFPRKQVVDINVHFFSFLLFYFKAVKAIKIYRRRGVEIYTVKKPFKFMPIEARKIRQ